MDYKIIKQYLDKQKIKVVDTYDFEHKKVKYSEKIKGWKIDKFRGDEEIVRAFVLAKLVNKLGYKSENKELKKQFDALSKKLEETNKALDNVNTTLKQKEFILLK